jgi:predicted Fe-Mo cluster-binding NifX family protein
MKRTLITVLENEIAPRFDLATEVIVVTFAQRRPDEQTRTLVLAHPSAEDLCQLILDEEAESVVCGGIEQEYFDYLTWKSILVIDSVAGPWKAAVRQLHEGRLNAGDVLFSSPNEEGHD